MILTNSLAVFRLIRSYCVLKDIYKHEKLYSDPKSEWNSKNHDEEKVPKTNVCDSFIFVQVVV